MQIRYLGNSGFALRENGTLLIVDCYNPARHAWLHDGSLAEYTSITVLVSHSHGDHFARSLLRLAGAQCAVGTGVSAPDGTVTLQAGEEAVLNGHTVRAFGSTDEGVSFAVRFCDTLFFHAGDLNNWHWRDESDLAYAARAEQDFLAVLNKIAVLCIVPDIACFPADPRMGSDYYRGAVQFAQSLRPRKLVPMHFGKSFAPPAVFLEELRPFTEVFTAPLTAVDWVDV